MAKVPRTAKPRIVVPTSGPPQEYLAMAAAQMGAMGKLGPGPTDPTALPATPSVV